MKLALSLNTCWENCEVVGGGELECMEIRLRQSEAT